MDEGTFFLIVMIILYFVPAAIAAARDHHNMGAIIALNVFLGWTVLGWVGALVWAFTNPANQPDPAKSLEPDSNGDVVL